MEPCEIISQSSFSMLAGKVNDNILTSLHEMGLTKPTEIQAKTLPYLLSGKDIIGAAKTGSGKTLAFLIPVANKLMSLNFSEKHGTGCIILSPTRELALQTYKVLEKLLSNTSLSCLLVVGGENKSVEAKSLALGKSIVVATPGRLLDHILSTPKFNYKYLQCLVVDEADKLLEAGFQRHLTGIIEKLPKTRQTVLFSATITDQVKDLANLAMKNEPIYVSVSDLSVSTVTGLSQGYVICPIEKRISWLFKMLQKTKKQKVMVFFSSCKSVDFHHEFFANHCKADVVRIHGRLSQSKRRSSFQAFVEAKQGALFCTDVAARGLDIPDVDWIVQYDPPTDPKEYIHRVGRTARGINGTGNAVLLLRPEEKNFIDFLKQKKVTIDKYNLDYGDNKVQNMMNELVSTNGVFKTQARKAFLVSLKCYKMHPMKKVFNFKKLDLNATAKAFGFDVTPHIDLGK